MSRNEIRLDQIQQRLGNSHRPQTHYDDQGWDKPPVHDDHHAQHDDGATLSAGFIATIAAVSISAGMGTYFFIGGAPEIPNFGLNWGSGGGSGGGTEIALSGSVLDPVCGKGWKAEVMNVDQMYCYMTRQVYRLCDTKEHKALLATINQFDKDFKVWNRKLMVASFKSIGKMQTQGMQLGLEAAKLDNMKGSDEDQAKQFDKVTGIAGDIMAPANKILAEHASTTPAYELDNAAYALIKKGYISAEDFGYSKPDFISNALKKAGKVKTACPNRG